MALSYAKVDANLDSHPKIRKAGNLGRQVFEFMLRRNAILDLGGIVPASYAEPWYLADQLMMSESDAASGLSRAVTAGLLAVTPQGIQILGWDREWGKRPLDEAERKRLQRARQKSDREDPDTCDDMSRKCPDAIVTCPDMSHGDRDCPECHAREEKRREEKRESEPARASAIPPTAVPSTEYDANSLPAGPPAVTPQAQERTALHRKLVSDAWLLAGQSYRALQAEGVDPHATAKPWAGLPGPSSPPMVDLRKIVSGLLSDASFSGPVVWETLSRGIAVAAAKARKRGRLDFLTPARLWEPSSFAIDSAMTVAQVENAPTRGPHPHRTKTGRVEPLPASAYPEGEVEL